MEQDLLALSEEKSTGKIKKVLCHLCSSSIEDITNYSWELIPLLIKALASPSPSNAVLSLSLLIRYAQETSSPKEALLLLNNDGVRTNYAPKYSITFYLTCIMVRIGMPLLPALCFIQPITSSCPCFIPTQTCAPNCSVLSPKDCSSTS